MPNTSTEQAPTSLSALLNEFETPTTKTAAEAVTGAQPTPADLQASIQQKQASIQTMLTEFNGGTKTASEGTPAGSVSSDLEKIASDLAAAGDAATLRTAELYGAAVFEGFIKRANAYAEHQPAELTKTAATQQADIEASRRAGYSEMSATLLKLAAQSAADPREAAAKTYKAQLEKLASSTYNSYTRGYTALETYYTNQQQGG